MLYDFYYFPKMYILSFRGSLSLLLLATNLMCHEGDAVGKRKALSGKAATYLLMMPLI